MLIQIKTAATKGCINDVLSENYIRGVKSYNWQQFNKRIWQRNYWEHIIRYENDFIGISEYICNNPVSWKGDKLNICDDNSVSGTNPNFHSVTKIESY
jgi:REP element-mobilizing transposase RayT